MKKSKLIALLAICAMSATIAAGCSNPFASNKDSSSNSSVESSSSLGDESSSSATDKESSSSVKTDESSSTNGGNNSDSGSSGSDGSDGSSSDGEEQTDATISIAKANEIGKALGKDETTKDWYYVTGIIANVDDLNGTLTIKEGEDSIYVYKLSNYATQETRLIVGDEITVHCQIQYYNGKKVELVNGEITASKDNTSATLPKEPAADSKLTIAEALELSNALTIPTANKYYVTGTISEIKDTKFGNLYIKDEDGNSLYVYGVYDENNTRYDGLENKPQLGDKVVLYSAIYNYFGTPQLKNAVCKEVTIGYETIATEETLSFTTENATATVTKNLDAGMYAIYALDDGFNALSDVKFSVSEDEEALPQLTFTVAESGEITINAAWTASGSDAACTCKYYLFKLSAVQISGSYGFAELASGVFTPVTFVAPNAGTFILSNDKSLTWSEEQNGDSNGKSYVITATEANETITIYVKYDNFNDPTFAFDWKLLDIPQYTLTLDEAKEALVYNGTQSPISFTASESGWYKLTAIKADQTEDEDNPFYVGVKYDDYDHSYTFYAAKDVPVKGLHVEYNTYGAKATDTATLKITKLELADASNLQVGANNFMATTEGTQLTFKAPEAGWYSISDGWNGYLFFEDTIESEWDGPGDYNKVVQLAKDETIVFTLKYIDFSGNESALVTVTIEKTEEPAPQINLTVGENTITVYGEDDGVEVVLDNTFVTMTFYTFTWSNENVVITRDYGTPIVSGTSFKLSQRPQFSIYTQDGTTLENFALTIDGKKASTGGDEDDGTFTKFSLGDNELSGRETFALFSFTATEACDYIFSTTANVNIYKAIYDFGDWCHDSEESDAYLNSAGSFTLTLTAGEMVRFYLETYDTLENGSYASIDGIIIEIAKDGGSETPDTPVDPNPENKLQAVVLDVETTIQDENMCNKTFKFTASEAGSYTLNVKLESLSLYNTVAKGNGWEKSGADLLVNGSYTFTLAANETIVFIIKENMEYTISCSVTISKADTRTENQKIVDELYALQAGEEKTGEYTLTGTISKVDYAYSTQYKNVTVTITVDGREDKPVQLYYLSGTGAELIMVGDTVTVNCTTLKNYEKNSTSTYELVRPTIVSYVEADQAKHIAKKLELSANEISVKKQITETGDIELASTAKYEGIIITWDLENASEVADYVTLEDKVLSVKALPEAEITLNLTVMLAWEDTTDSKTKNFNDITVKKLAEGETSSLLPQKNVAYHLASADKTAYASGYGTNKSGKGYLTVTTNKNEAKEIYFKLVEGTTNTFYIYYLDGANTYYITSYDSSNNLLQKTEAERTEASKWIITVTETGDVTIQNAKNTAYSLQYNSNSEQERISQYTKAQNPITFVKA